MDETTEKLAREAGMEVWDVVSDPWFSSPHYDGIKLSQLERFAALVRADERNRCAQVCDAALKQCKDSEQQLEPDELLEKLALISASRQAERLAAALRSGEATNG